MSRRTNNIFFTGEIQIGKSTALRKIMNELKADFGGYCGYSYHENGKKYLRAVSLLDGEDHILAIMDHENSIFDIRRGLFDSDMANIVEKSLEAKEIIVLDELGRFEENSERFKKAVFDCLDSEKLVLGVLKKQHGPFVDSIMARDDVIVFTVDEKNRDEMPERVLELISKMKS